MPTERVRDRSSNKKNPIRRRPWLRRSGARRLGSRSGLGDALGTEASQRSHLEGEPQPTRHLGAPEQCAAARAAVAGEEAVYVPQVVQAELSWVLATAFEFDRERGAACRRSAVALL